MLINYGKQFTDKNDKRFIIKSFDQQNLTNGKYLNLFENKIKNYLNANMLLHVQVALQRFF